MRKDIEKDFRKRKIKNIITLSVTHKDLKIGQELICIKQNTENYNGGEKDMKDLY